MRAERPTPCQPSIRGAALCPGALILEKEMHGERMRYFRLMLGALSAAGEVEPGAWIPSSS